MTPLHGCKEISYEAEMAKGKIEGITTPVYTKVQLPEGIFHLLEIYPYIQTKQTNPYIQTKQTKSKQNLYT